jgi:hypothetical protein
MENGQLALKSAFATMMGVSAARVSQWLNEGKIGPEALAGAGRSARIIVPVAVEHLKERLDTSQRFGLNGLGTRLDQAGADAPPAVPQVCGSLFAPAPSTPAPPKPVVDTVEAQLKAHKLRQAELATRRQEEEDRLARGVYVLASEAQAATTKACAKLLEALDGSLVDIAGEFAAKYEIPSRDALHLLRAQINKMRGRISEDFAAMASAAPETIEDLDRHD